MRSFLKVLSIPLFVTGCFGDTCPTSERTGDELPCSCGGETIDALPGDGSSCYCDKEGFHCDDPVYETGDTGDSQDTDDTGNKLANCPIGQVGSEDLPCDCAGEAVEVMPQDGASCVCAEDGFFCDGTGGFEDLEISVELLLWGDYGPELCSAADLAVVNHGPVEQRVAFGSINVFLVQDGSFFMEYPLGVEMTLPPGGKTIADYELFCEEVETLPCMENLEALATVTDLLGSATWELPVGGSYTPLPCAD